MIQEVESQYTQTYIANVFWRQDIAKVSSITLIPYIKNSEIYSIAYINIAEWCDSEVAFNFIQRLTNPEREARIIYNDDNWWPVELNTHNNGDINVGAYTVVFDLDYFENDTCDVSTADCTEVNDEEYICDDEECHKFDEFRPIKGLRNDYYSVEEALGHLCDLNDQLNYVMSGFKHSQLEEEILHFEKELHIHNAVNNSDNVTQRTHYYGNMTDEEAFDLLPYWFEEELKHEVAGEWYRENLFEYDADLCREVARNCDEIFV